jgi:hypothetical protein
MAIERSSAQPSGFFVVEDEMMIHTSGPLAGENFPSG